MKVHRGGTQHGHYAAGHTLDREFRWGAVRPTTRLSTVSTVGTAAR
jgi:hypothetical protein